MCRSTDFDRFQISQKPFPDFLTLRFLTTRPVFPAFLTLYRVKSSTVFRSREAVRIEGEVRFEVYMSDETFMEGIIVKDEVRNGKLECEVEVCMEVEGHVAVNGKNKKKKKRVSCTRLEEIPEEIENGSESDGCDSYSGDLVSRMDGCDSEEDSSREIEMEREIERVRWAVDFGIWVTCLGVGYLISKTSFANALLRRRKLL